VTPAHDEPLEEQAARAQTNSGYARNGTLFPQVYRAAAPPFASKKFAFHGFFFSSPSLTHTNLKSHSPSKPQTSDGTRRLLLVLDAHIVLCTAGSIRGPTMHISLVYGTTA